MIFSPPRSRNLPAPQLGGYGSHHLLQHHFSVLLPLGQPLLHLLAELRVAQHQDLRLQQAVLRQPGSRAASQVLQLAHGPFPRPAEAG
jgi:hypothetical protein